VLGIGRFDLTLRTFDFRPLVPIPYIMSGL
jgi:hypothetical protein